METLTEDDLHHPANAKGLDAWYVFRHGWFLDRIDCFIASSVHKALIRRVEQRIGQQLRRPINAQADRLCNH